MKGWKAKEIRNKERRIIGYFIILLNIRKTKPAKSDTSTIDQSVKRDMYIYSTQLLFIYAVKICGQSRKQSNIKACKNLHSTNKNISLNFVDPSKGFSIRIPAVESRKVYELLVNGEVFWNLGTLSSWPEECDNYSWRCPIIRHFFSSIKYLLGILISQSTWAHLNL